MSERLFTTYQVADLLGATPGAVMEWIRKGWMPIQQVGDGTTRISERGLVKFLRQQGIDIEKILARVAAREKAAAPGAADADSGWPAGEARGDHERVSRVPEPESGRPTTPARAEPAGEAASEDIPARPAVAPQQAVSAPPAPDERVRAEPLEPELTEIAIESEPVVGDASAGLPPAATDDRPHAPVEQVADAILRDAIHRGAQAIHLEQRGEALILRLRIDGEIHDKPQFAALLPPGVREGLLAHLRSRAGVETAGAAREGHFTARLDGDVMAVRAVAAATAEGEKLVMYPRQPAATLADLGATAEQQAALEALLMRPGLILVTGVWPRDRRLALEALVRAGQPERRSVAAITRAWPWPLAGATGWVVGQQVEDYAPGVAAARALDADLIVVDELAGPSAAAEASDAAREGATVLAAMNVPDVHAAMELLAEMEMLAWPLSLTVSGVVEQARLRELCADCVGRGRRGDGAGASSCSRCGGSGYVGCHRLFNVLESAEGLAAMIRRELKGPSRIAEAPATLRDRASQLVRAGRTTATELARAGLTASSGHA